MKRDLTLEDREKITQAILVGDRVEAINIYISITEGGLTEAQTFVKALTEELKETKPEKFARRQPKKARFGIFKDGQKK
jgi:ribosomal protein L7/L12